MNYVSISFALFGLAGSDFLMNGSPLYFVALIGSPRCEYFAPLRLIDSLLPVFLMRFICPVRSIDWFSLTAVDFRMARLSSAPARSLFRIGSPLFFVPRFGLAVLPLCV